MKVTIETLCFNEALGIYGYTIQYKKHWWSRWKLLMDIDGRPKTYLDKNNAYIKARDILKHGL